MPKFTLWRSFDPSWREPDFEMMLVRSIATAWMEPRYQWQRSYGFEKSGINQGFCVYEGPSVRDLTWQQRMCWIPFDEIRTVDEVQGEDCGSGPDEAPTGTSLYFVERNFGSGSSIDVLDEVNGIRNLAGSGVTWVRSFWDGGRASSKCIFAAEAEAGLRSVVDVPGASVESLELVQTNHPSLWADAYDRMGLPRHWEIKEEQDNANLRYLARA